MNMGKRAWLLLAAAPLVAGLAGCGDFWEAPGSGSTSFTVASNENILVAPGATTGNTSTITVTQSGSFTGTVALTCTVASPSGAVSPTTCGLNPASVSISSSSTAPTSTLTATTTSSTTAGDYTITVTGTSGSVSQTISVCVAVGSSACSTAASTSGNFYILNSSISSGSTNTIAGYYISASALKAISGSSYTLNGVGYAVAMAPNGKFLCVSSTDGVYAYPITNGALGTGVVVTQDLAYSIQIDSTNSWLLEAVPYPGGSGGVTLNAVNINSSNGTKILNSSIPTAGFTVANAYLPLGQMVISPDNKFIFVALETGGTIVVPFNSSNPLPTGVTYTYISADNGGSVLSVAVDPSSTPRLFYIGQSLGDTTGKTGGLRAFNYASLPSISEISSSKIASGGLVPNFILPVATPDYVYVADGTGSITGFSVTGSGSSYTLATGSTVTAGDEASGMALDSTGSYVFEVSWSGSPYFDAYTFDSNTTGQLDSQVTSTAPANSIAVVAAP